MLSRSSFLKNNTISNSSRVQTHSFPRGFWGRSALSTSHFLWASLSPVWKQREVRGDAGGLTNTLFGLWRVQVLSSIEKRKTSLCPGQMICKLLHSKHSFHHYYHIFRRFHTTCLFLFFTVKVFLFYINLIFIICWYTLLSFIRWPKRKQNKKKNWVFMHFPSITGIWGRRGTEPGAILCHTSCFAR